MTKQKLFKHVLPIILSAMLLFSALPMSASANDESTDKVASKIVREVVELREESVKHFLCEDGSYIAVSYAEPVHYEKNGEWLEIDNTLVLSSENTYVPKSSDLAVSIPQSFSGGGQITATNDGHTISFGVASGNENVALSKTAAVKAVEALPSTIAADVSVETLANAELSATATVGKVDTVAQIEAYNSEKTTVDNQAGALVYDKIFPNADLEYIVTGNSIKENVVVYQPQTEYVYTFDMDFGGLTPVAQEDGSYKLVDSAKPEETVFVLAAPYMYDANGEESYEVEMSLTQNGGNYLLTLTADEEWINSSETTLPVTINQTENYKFDDVFVIDGLFANSPRVKKELRVGKNLTNITRTYIKIAEPHNIPYGSKINYAKLILKNKNYYQAPLQDNIDIKLYDCSNVATWSATSVTWNNQPFGNTAGSYSSYNADLLCTVPATDNEGSDYEFNIKTAVENWLETGTNKGFMLASSNESSKTQIDFYSSRADLYQPVIRVNYEEPYLSLTEWVPNQNAATSPAITVSSTKNWTASANQSWISVSPSSGAGGSSFTISVTENPNTSAREGEVTVMAGTSTIGTVKVIQTGSDPFLSVSNTDLYFKP
ncbi:MAG: BACON domain-containing protein, partial [Clostridia bacterium]|nr:BACON domain-containing protein [Clostridia bacterium]